MEGPAQYLDEQVNGIALLVLVWPSPARPEKFDPDLVCDLAEEVAYLDQSLQAGRLID